MSTQEIIDKTGFFVKEVDAKFTKYIMVIGTFFLHQSKNILKFLSEKNVISAGIAIIVGTQI